MRVAGRGGGREGYWCRKPLLTIKGNRCRKGNRAKVWLKL